MKNDVSKYDYVADKDLCEITMTNDHQMKVTLLNYGATIEKVLVPNGKALDNVVVSLDRPQDYSSNRCYLGATLGRVAGVIKNGAWRVGPVVNYLNLEKGQRDHINGGIQGFDTLTFDFTTVVGKSEVSTIMTVLDAADHNGYPGNLLVKVTFTLTNENLLKCSIDAQADRLTLFNPTNHVYFCLNGPRTNILDNELSVDSDQYLPTNERQLPSEGRHFVTKTDFDFRHGQKLGDVLTSSDPQIVNHRGLLHPLLVNVAQPNVARLTSPRTQRSVTMTTQAPAIIVDTGNDFGKSPLTGLNQYCGVALDAQISPTNSADLTQMCLMPGQKFNTWTNWQFRF